MVTISSGAATRTPAPGAGTRRLARLAFFLSLSSLAAAQDFAAIDRIIEANLGRLPAGVSLFLARSDRPLYNKSYGPIIPTRPLPIASATKWISGAVLMAAVDDGLLSLDDPAARWIPELNEGAKARITMRQLFSLTSGISAQDSPCLSRSNITLAACAREIAAQPLEAPPGSGFIYGGGSMQIAGRIVEIVAGRPYVEYYRERIAKPLGFRSCDYADDNNPRVAGGINCTPGEYLDFLRMILNRGVFNGKAVLSSAAVDEMLRDQTRGARIIASPYANVAPPGSPLAQARYGIGQWMELLSPSDGEALSIASPGAFGVCPWIDPRRDVAGVFFTFGLLQAGFPVYLEVKRELERGIPLTPQPASAILNAANYASTAMAPGMIFTLFGQGLGPGALSGARLDNNRLTAVNGQMRVLFDGTPAPLIFTQSRQLAGIVPYDVAGKSEVAVTLEYGSLRAEPFRAKVSPVALGLFDVPLPPFRTGGIVTLWATGEGLLRPALPDGSLHPSPASLPLAPISVRFSGIPAQVLYAGGSPGSVAGLLQINVRVPELPPGPVRIEISSP